MLNKDWVPDEEGTRTNRAIILGSRWFEKPLNLESATRIGKEIEAQSNGGVDGQTHVNEVIESLRRIALRGQESFS